MFAICIWVHLPAAAEQTRILTKISGPNATVLLDTQDAPELREWALKAGNLCIEWFPKLAELLPSDGFKPPTEVLLFFDKDLKGVAHASAGRITISVDYVRAHPDDWGMVIHELTHIVQAYPPTGPGWLVEGIADYIRIVHYEPKAVRPVIDFSKANYQDAYKTAAMFLEWLENHGHPDLVKNLNAALRKGTFTDALWNQLAGKTVDHCWAAFSADMIKQKNAK